ncbi:hypothetical protein CHUAL_008996 [Chamberlinius hualienensis]
MMMTSLLQIILLVLIEKVWSLNSPEGPIFVLEPPDRVDFSNTTGAIIHCVAKSNPPAKILWIRSTDNAEGETIGSIPELRTIYPNGSLHFLSFKAEIYRHDIHSTIYRCLASNTIGTIISRDVKIRAVVKQKYEANVYDEFMIGHNTAVIKCHIPSFVKDDVIVTSWVTDDGKGGQKTIIGNEGRFSVFPNGALHIRDFGEQDVRKYRCITKHILTGEIKSSASSGQPILTMEVALNQNVEVPCAAQGYPNPSYKWLKMKHGRSEAIKYGGRYEQKSGSLFIQEVQVGDEGLYVCQANNTLSHQQIETTLSVFAPLWASIDPSTIKVELGKRVNLNCSTGGYPISSIYWIKNGKHLLPNPRISYPSPDVLRIEGIRREDRGMYQCFVKNKGSSAQATAEIQLGGMSI